jgi:hypothetical protein
MIDQVSNKGFAELAAPATVTTSGAGSGVLNLLTGPAGTGAPNSPTLGQPQGTIAFVLDSTVLTGNGTYVAQIQTSSDNSTFTNVTSAVTKAVSSTANTAGLQVIFVDSASLSQYTRVYDVTTATTSVIRSVMAVFVPKNP